MKQISAFSAASVVGLSIVAILAFSPGLRSASGGTTPVLPGILLNEDDNGAVREARVGDYFLICLQDPWGGGYGWEIAEIVGDAIRPIGRSQHMPGPGDWSWGQDRGRPDTAYFRLLAAREGQTTISLICTPPPGIMAPVHLYTITLNILP